MNGLRKKQKNQTRIRCIAYLCATGDLYSIEKNENKQFRYLKDYASAHGIDICKVIRRNGMAQALINEHWKIMTEMIKKGVADGILIVNTEAVSTCVCDSFFKIGQVYEVGGVVVTVDEGRLGMPIRRMKNGRMVLVNEKY